MNHLPLLLKKARRLFLLLRGPVQLFLFMPVRGRAAESDALRNAQNPLVDAKSIMTDNTFEYERTIGQYLLSPDLRQ